MTIRGEAKRSCRLGESCRLEIERCNIADRGIARRLETVGVLTRLMGNGGSAGSLLINLKPGRHKY